MNIKPKKSLGQHFLHSKEIVTKIVDVSMVSPGDAVLEIGPGEGVLTAALLNAGARVIAVETDRQLIPMLQVRFDDAIRDGRLDLIHGDILNRKLEDEIFHTDLAGDRPYKVVANIPYYITGALFRLFLEEYRQPTTLTFLVQKEVAEQIVGKHGKESILSLSVKFYGDPTYAGKVGREHFDPPPKVDSAILIVDNISRTRWDGVAEKKFFSVVKSGFRAKRKMLIGNLSDGLHIPKDKLLTIFALLKISEKIRAEDLPITTWVSLVRELERKSA